MGLPETIAPILLPCKGRIKRRFPQLIYRHLIVLPNRLKAAIEAEPELLKAFGRVVEVFKLTNVQVAHGILVEQRQSCLRTRGAEYLVYLPGPSPNSATIPPSLLLLVPLPANNRW